MTALDELIYQAITADTDLMEAVGNRVRSTCFEVSPDEQDNTPLPSIIVTDDGLQASVETKENEWLPYEDHVTAGVEISARSPREVRQLAGMVRRAVADYMTALSDEERPVLDAFSTDGTAWDWLKPCYFDTLRYQCTVETESNDDDNE